MMGTMAKTKISISVDAHVLDRARKLTPDVSRSELFEIALRSWVRAQRRRQVEDEVARYYGSLSKEDQEHDAAWAQLGDETLSGAD
jgi:metal-responsive CopG/Arc/MetJ family transcriptional regulator